MIRSKGYNPECKSKGKYYVYILSTSSNTLYIGQTPNIVNRLKNHNSGLVKSTKKYIPWKLIYLEDYANQEDALEREKKLKQFGKVYSQLKKRILRSLQS